MYETCDAGSFHTCGQDGTAWINRGNRAVNNTFRDIRPGPAVLGPEPLCFAHTVGFYMDDQESGWYVANNTFVNCDIGVLLGGGRRNTITGNSFTKLSLGIHFDNRGTCACRLRYIPRAILCFLFDPIIVYLHPPFHQA